MLFIHGTIRDSIVLLMTVANLLVRLFEEKLGRFAKYVYVSIMPFFGAVTIAVGADGKFGAITQCYFFILLIAIGYYDISVLKVNAVVTVISNIIGMIIFPKSCLRETVDNINHLKKNDEGIAAISELSLKFGENIKSTQAVSEEIKALSEKSAQITTGITTSVKEQMAGIEDIVQTLENVQKNVEHGAEGLKCVLENKGK